ncbi:MAG TPA: lysozyme inhibitor LprI family protein [Aromatoleum sp.]|uniref:lysozyme inhibitor LprI family protein n=1 Tax=Aromatoleum sp. TaxID=2307007 RepID=UPI002B459463|nr:lysozyme inhibitor LprI family protein [Aromatoleum sp.]HJV28370.1 lysozyme inhibitor LprI family protein [Aromatoleum sp.]
MKAVSFFLAVTAFSSAAFANSACDKPRDDFDDLYCLNKVYQEADSELNANYKKLKPLLDANGAAALKKGQLAWIEERNSRCSQRDGLEFFVNLSCATKRTISRAQFLQDRYRECVSAGCQNSKL